MAKTETNLKPVVLKKEELIQAFKAISEAIKVGEENYGGQCSNRVEEDWRIIQKVFAARALIEDIHAQLPPWAHAFGFNPREPEEVKLSWSLTVGKAVGICQELLRELRPGWQSRGRIGFNHPNTIDALLETIDSINSADLNKVLMEQAGETSQDNKQSSQQRPPNADIKKRAGKPDEAGDAATGDRSNSPEPKWVGPPAKKASQRLRRQPLRRAGPIKK